MDIWLTVIVVLGVASVFLFAWARKNDGYIVIKEKEDGGLLYSLELEGDPTEFSDGSRIVFTVRKERSSAS